MTYKKRVSIFDEFNKIFNGINTYDSNKLYNSIWQPDFQISEDDKSYHLSFDLPGVNRKDIDVSISNDLLTVSGSRESNCNHDERYSQLNQVSYGKFEKSFYLPDNADQNKVTSKIDNGVLSITLKRTKEVSDDIKKISIK